MVRLFALELCKRKEERPKPAGCFGSEVRYDGAAGSTEG